MFRGLIDRKFPLTAAFLDSQDALLPETWRKEASQEMYALDNQRISGAVTCDGSKVPSYDPETERAINAYRERVKHPYGRTCNLCGGH